MEININKDIREYTEGVFFGLNLRQLICSGLAVGSAVAVYFGCRGTISQDMITYFCIAAAIPFAAIGFIKYNGMPMEKIFAWIFGFEGKVRIKGPKDINERYVRMVSKEMARL